MTIDAKIRDIKLQQYKNRDVAKISASFSGKIDEYEHTTDEEILTHNHRQITEHPKFTYSP